MNRFLGRDGCGILNGKYFLAKQILKEVDDIIVKGKVDKNPEKLLQKSKKKVKIDGKEVEVDRSEALEVELKNIKAN